MKAKDHALNDALEEYHQLIESGESEEDALDRMYYLHPITMSRLLKVLEESEEGGGG